MLYFKGLPRQKLVKSGFIRKSSILRSVAEHILMRMYRNGDLVDEKWSFNSKSTCITYGQKAGGGVS